MRLPVAIIFIFFFLFAEAGILPVANLPGKLDYNLEIRAFCPHPLDVNDARYFFVTY